MNDSAPGRDAWDREQALAKQRQAELLARRVFVLLLVLVSCAPLYILLLMVRSLAGQATVVDVSISVVATISVAVSILWKRKKLQSQHDELVRLRSRLEFYEGRSTSTGQEFGRCSA